MKAPSNSEKLQRNYGRNFRQAGRSPVPIEPLERLRMVPTQLLRPVATQTSSVGPTGQLEGIQVATDGSGLICEACKVVPALKPGVRTGETYSSARRSLVEEVLA
jgi:hypothetical protein